MKHVRPYEALELFSADSYANRLVSVVLPDRHAPIFLETAIQLALVRHVRPERFFEFGTLIGITALNVVANMPPEGIVYTLDLDEGAFERARQHSYDHSRSLVHFEHEDRLAFLGTPYEERVIRLYGDSNTFDFSAYASRIQMVYIDGGHDLRTVRSDTENALRMIDRSRRGCILWHDYGNPRYPDLTTYLDELSQTHELRHVEETKLCFWCQEPSRG